MNPFFSVIIPAYNAERTIEHCLKSLINQTFTDFEAIIIDDGSNDNTADIVSNYTFKYERFHYVKQTNNGVSSARNNGLKRAVGKYIVFLDSDDQYAPDYLQRFFDVIIANPDCDCIWCGYRVTTPDGTILKEHAFNKSGALISQTERGRIMEIGRKSLVSPLWNKAFKREVINSNNLTMDNNLSLGEDILFNYAYLDKCKPEILIINSPLYLYTKSANDTLDSKYRSDLQAIYEKVDNMILSYLTKWEVTERQLKIFHTAVFWHYNQVLHNTMRSENKMSAKEKNTINNELMKKNEFQKALEYARNTMKPIYYKAYKSGKWRNIRILDSLLNIRKKVFRKI